MSLRSQSPGFTSVMQDRRRGHSSECREFELQPHKDEGGVLENKINLLKTFLKESRPSLHLTSKQSYKIVENKNCYLSQMRKLRFVEVQILD